MFAPALLALAVAAAAEPAELQAIWELEARRLPPDALLPYTSHTDPHLRARAALALGRLRHPAAVAELQRLVEDPEPEVRRQAAFGLGLTPEAAPVVAARLGLEAVPEVRAALYGALGRVGGPEHVPTLVDGLSRSAGEARDAAVALGRLGMAHPAEVATSAALQGLTDQLRTRLDPDTRRAAAFALARLGPTQVPGAAHAELRRRVTGDADPVVRASLVRALVPSSTPEQASQLVQDAARDDALGVRLAAARALAKVPELPVGLVIEVLLQDGAAGVREEAARALGSREPAPEELDAWLRPLLEDDATAVAGAALTALVQRGLEPSRGWLADHRPEPLQAAAVAGLGQPEHLAQLVRLATGSASALVRTTAAATLGGLDGAADHAEALIAAEDVKVRSVGLTLLAELPPGPVASPRVVRAATDALTGADRDLDLLSSALQALATHGPMGGPPSPALREPVRLALLHPSAAVRRAAQPVGALLGMEPLPALPAFTFGRALPPLGEVERVVGARILTDVGELRVALFPDLAPATVWNFASLAEADFFDGRHFHRVVPNFVVQDGCPRGDGWGDPGYAIPDELTDLRYDRGVLGMALSGPDTGGSQWFVTLSPQPHLEGAYTVFGEVTLENGTLDRIRAGTVIHDVVVERTRPPAPEAP